MRLRSFTALLLLVMMQTASNAQQQLQTHQLDIKKSKMLWTTKMGSHAGSMLFNSGSLQYSAKGEPLKGFFTMDINSIRSTDNPEEADRKKTDANIKGVDFFAADRYPTSTMNVKKITRIGTSTNFNVQGDLTIKGITNAIEFTAAIITKGNTTLITGNTDISHLLWGLDPKVKPNSLDFMATIKEKMVPDIHISLDLVLTK